LNKYVYQEMQKSNKGCLMAEALKLLRTMFEPEDNFMNVSSLCTQENLPLGVYEQQNFLEVVKQMVCYQACRHNG
jgi:hypothetical protein